MGHDPVPSRVKKAVAAKESVAVDEDPAEASGEGLRQIGVPMREWVLPLPNCRQQLR